MSPRPPGCERAFVESDGCWTGFASYLQNRVTWADGQNSVSGDLETGRWPSFNPRHSTAAGKRFERVESPLTVRRHETCGEESSGQLAEGAELHL